MKISKKLFSDLVGLAAINAVQRKLLLEAAESKSATQAVKNSGVPPSTAWHNLRELRRKGLLKFGEKRDLNLTQLGKAIVSIKRR